MREFTLYPHGGGRNFLGALQVVIRGMESPKQIQAVIEGRNLFDDTYPPVNFNPEFFIRTPWNKELIRCQEVWIEYLSKRRTQASAKKQIIDLLNECYQGSFHLKTALPTISRYSIVCIVESQILHQWLDQLATIKKDLEKYTKTNVHESNLCFSNNLDLLHTYRADWSFSYSDMFFELNTTLHEDFIKRTEDCFKVKSAVDLNTITDLINNYNERNHQILIYE